MAREEEAPSRVAVEDHVVGEINQAFPLEEAVESKVVVGQQLVLESQLLAAVQLRGELSHVQAQQHLVELNHAMAQQQAEELKPVAAHVVPLQLTVEVNRAVKM